ESAHWADSATTESPQAASFFRHSQMRVWLAPPAASFEFPAAIQALRTSPRHFVRFSGLPRDSLRKSSSLNDKSDSNRGRNNESFRASAGAAVLPASRDGRVLGRNCVSAETGARRFHGQTCWQMSQPKA